MEKRFLKLILFAGRVHPRGFRRHEDEIRKLEEKHVSQRETEIKAHEQRLEIITKKQELSRSTSLKEQRQAMDKLLKATAASRSRVEDELKRVATRRQYNGHKKV